MVNCVLISEEENHITDVEVNIKGDDLYRILKGTGTFIGQLPESDVVIMKCDVSVFDLMMNRNSLPEPFHEEVVLGPILLIRMDEEANPQNFTVNEYLSFLSRNPSLPL
jgi:hypothetical protein